MAAIASGSLSSGAWPTPSTVATFICGATACILTAVEAVRRSLFAPLTTSSGFCADFAAVGDRLSFAGTLGYLDAKYLHFITPVSVDVNGNPIIDPVTGKPTTIEADVADFRKIQNTPKWTLSGSLDYTTPLADGRLDINSTLSYRSSSQQFELASPGLDQKGFSLWDANIVWRSRGGRYELGLHGKNLGNKKYIVSGYNFLTQNPWTGAYVLVPTGKPIPAGGLGQTGVLTAFYGNPRQIFLSAAVNF